MLLCSALSAFRGSVLAQEVCMDADHSCISHHRYEPIVEAGVNVVTSP